MITLVIISVVLFFVGVTLIMIYFLDDANYAKDWLFIAGIILVFIGGISSLVFGILSGNHINSTKIKEYPASEYTLSYKITEFEGQRDTSYVLIPKEK